MLGSVIITASGGEQGKIPGALGVYTGLVAAMATGNHLDANAPQLAEFADQMPHFEAREAVAGRVGVENLRVLRGLIRE